MVWKVWDKIRIKRVYVVEDNESDRMLLRMNLNLDNCLVEYFNSSEGVIKEFMKRRPDAVIIDYYLAGRTTGDKLLEFCDNNGICALLVTGNEGDILGVDSSRIMRKSPDKSYYKALEDWTREVIA